MRRPRQGSRGRGCVPAHGPALALLQRECRQLALDGLHHHDIVGHRRLAGDRTAHAGTRGEGAIVQAQPVDHAVEVADHGVVALHRRPDLWPDAERFDPGRWQGQGTPPQPWSYVPFLEGPRKCIGRHLAELEFVVVLCALLRRSDIRVGGEARLTRFMIPRFATPLPFTVEPLAS